jgi:hypothetical protein
MQDLDVNGITDAVIEQMATTPDPRMREIMEAAVRHLHAFARDVNLTPEEWLKGIAFMTAVGQACTPYRQEFILLSDVLGLSRLVNVMHDSQGREAAGTETSLLGPVLPRGCAQGRARRQHRPPGRRARDPDPRPGRRYRWQGRAACGDRCVADRCGGAVRPPGA